MTGLSPTDKVLEALKQKHTAIRLLEAAKTIFYLVERTIMKPFRQQPVFIECGQHIPSLLSAFDALALLSNRTIFLDFADVIGGEKDLAIVVA